MIGDSNVLQPVSQRPPKSIVGRPSHV
jgi:hypothetical protein